MNCAKANIVTASLCMAILKKRGLISPSTAGIMIGQIWDSGGSVISQRCLKRGDFFEKY